MKKKRMSNKTFRRITIPVMAVVLAALIVKILLLLGQRK